MMTALREGKAIQSTHRLPGRMRWRPVVEYKIVHDAVAQPSIGRSTAAPGMGDLVSELEHRRLRRFDDQSLAGIDRVEKLLLIRGETMRTIGRQLGRRVPDRAKCRIRRVSVGEEAMEPEVMVALRTFFPISLNHPAPVFDDVAAAFGGKKPARQHDIRHRPVERKE